MCQSALPKHAYIGGCRSDVWVKCISEAVNDRSFGVFGFGFVFLGHEKDTLCILD